MTPNRRRAAPARQNSNPGQLRASGPTTPPASANILIPEDEVKRLAKLLMEGNMSGASQLLKDKYLQNIESYEGPKNSNQLPHGRGKLTFRNGDIYEGDFVYVDSTLTCIRVSPSPDEVFL